MLVRDYMTKNPVTIDPNASLARADIIMKAGGFRRLPVVKEGRLYGIISEYDLRSYFDLDQVSVATAMTPVPVTVAPSSTLEHATSLLNKFEIGALPVVDGESVVGIITAKDVWIPEPRPLEEWIPSGRHII